MKKLLFAFIALAISVSAIAAEQVPIDESRLPKSALKFISTHYPQEKISIATMERDFTQKDYKVILTSGIALEFDSHGNWTEVQSKRGSFVPAAVVPANIAQYISARFPGVNVTKIERDKRSTDVKLSNGIELEFNKRGQLIEIDN